MKGCSSSTFNVRLTEMVDILATIEKIWKRKGRKDIQSKISTLNQKQEFK